MLHRSTEVWDEALQFILFLARLGVVPAAGARILDFGCGEGKTVFRFRELGFEAYGFDIHDRVAYRNESDRRYFRFYRGLSSDTSDSRFDEQYRMPFADDTFDLVYSNSVIEHVMHLDPVMRECARVMKPDGLAAHFYPAKFGLVEPHIYVPLASFYHPHWWLAFWARAGVRNEFQTHLPWQRVVANNERYYRSGLRHYTQKEIAETAGRYFGRVEFPSQRLVFPNDSWRAWLLGKLLALRDPHPYRALAQSQRISVFTCQGKLPASNVDPEIPPNEWRSSDADSHEADVPASTGRQCVAAIR